MHENFARDQDTLIEQSFLQQKANYSTVCKDNHLSLYCTLVVVYFMILHTAHTGLPPVNTIPATSTTVTTGKHRRIAALYLPTPPDTLENLAVPVDNVTIVTPVEERQITSPTEQAMRESSKHNEGSNMQCWK